VEDNLSFAKHSVEKEKLSIGYFFYGSFYGQLRSLENKAEQMIFHAGFGTG